MPSKPFPHNAPSTSARPTSSAVNDVLGLLGRKISATVTETAVPQPAPIRRLSITSKMDHILHPTRKERPSDEIRDRESKREKRGSFVIKAAMKPRDRTVSRGHASPGLGPVRPGRFEMIMESPPAVLHGSTTYSSGALISGRLKFNVEDPSGEVKLTKFTQEFRVLTTTKKPIAKDCRNCVAKYEVLKHWDFIKEPKKFLKNLDNQFPWSYLLAGRFPATTHSVLGSISYEVVTEAVTSTGETISHVHSLQVQRAIQPGPDKASIRIFPPTNLTGRVVMMPVVHPIGKFAVQMVLSGVIENKHDSQTRWRLKKMLWRIEEHTTIKSVPCDKHKGKVSEGKAIQHSESKQLGSDELKSGWKTGFDTAGGEIMLEFEAQLATRPGHHAVCDVESSTGLEVKHTLVIELIVAEEFVPLRNTNLITPTGAARVLRMQFNLVVTERAGMGISWDDEMPPMYEDVPPSPPHYAGGKSDRFAGAFIEDYHGPELDYVDLERIVTENPNDPPLYRQVDPVDRIQNTTRPRMHERLRRSTNGTNSGSEAGPSYIRRLAGFRLDELEAEPSFRRRENSNSEDEHAIIEDFGQGEAGTAALDDERPSHR